MQDLCGKQPVIRVHDDAAVLAPPSGEESAPPRRRVDGVERAVNFDLCTVQDIGERAAAMFDKLQVAFVMHSNDNGSRQRGPHGIERRI